MDIRTAAPSIFLAPGSFALSVGIRSQCSGFWQCSSKYLGL